MSDDKVYTYPGADQDISWDGRLCIHVGECGRADGELFVNGRKPWCQPDLAGADEAADVVSRCPTGALVLRAKDGTPVAQAPPARNTVTVANHGPLYVRGQLELAGTPDDAPGLTTRAALCRCGQSQRKPFCDNAHEAAGFRDRGAVGRTGGPAVDEGGTLSITPAPDGPLLLRGPLTIRSAAGEPRWHGGKTALCRCGASSTKPFCDGTHSRIGFTSG